MHLLWEANGGGVSNLWLFDKALDPAVAVCDNNAVLGWVLHLSMQKVGSIRSHQAGAGMSK